MSSPIGIILGATGASGGSNAGTTSANGTYTQVTGGNSTYNSAAQFTNGTDFIAWNSTNWGVYTAVNAGGTLLYTIAGTSSSITPAALATVSGGSSPGPSFALVTTGLSVQYIASGAGNSGANGTYLPIAGSNALSGGATQFTNGTDYLVFVNGANDWAISSVINNVSMPTNQIYYIPSTAISIPLTGWSIIGTSPAPTFTAGTPVPPAAASAPAIYATSTTAASGNPGALTSGATSCSIQVTLATDTGYTSPVGTLSSATPNTIDALGITLTAGTAYIFRTGMTNGAGTTYSPSTSLTMPTSLIATGGLITYDASFNEIHTFTTSGTLTPSRSLTGVSALIVGGGGAGGLAAGTTISGAGGGGAGQVTSQTGLSLTATGYSVVVAASSATTAGNSSSFNSTTAAGGGIGVASGIGSGSVSGGTSGNGYAGGNAYLGGGNGAGGGGGGAGGVGSSAVTTTAGTGGIGISSSISGTATWYGGGGGAAPSGAGGSGIGGIGGASGGNNPGGAGVANTGSGGGGAFDNGTGAAQGTGASGIVIISIPNPPIAPTGLAISYVSQSSSLQLNWNAASGATSYNILRSTVSGSGYAQYATSLTNSYTDTGTTPGTNYYYVVQTVNAAGNSSNSSQGTGISLAPSSYPTGISGSVTLNSVTLNWTNSLSSTGTNVYRSTSSGSGYTLLTLGSNVAGTTFTDSTVVTGTTYYYKLSALNSSGEGPLSGSSTDLPRSAVPATGLTASYTAGQGITLNWTAPAGYTGTGYILYRVSGASINGVGQRFAHPVPLTRIPWGTNTFIDRNIGYPPILSGANTHTYYVTVVNGALESVLSNAAGPVTFLG